jgi:hypothetical protein
MPKLQIILEADVTVAVAEVLTDNGLNLGYDDKGIYVYTSRQLPRIYPIGKEAYINHDEPIKLGGKHNAK